jgi:hypothetical protein
MSGSRPWGTGSLAANAGDTKTVQRMPRKNDLRRNIESLAVCAKQRLFGEILGQIGRKCPLEMAVVYSLYSPISLKLKQTG